LDGRKYKGTLTFASGGDLLESNETRVQYLAKMIENKEAVNSDLVWKEFKGVWHDETNSEGTLLYESGSKYVGQLKCNKRHGKGVYTYPSQIELNQAKARNPKMIVDERCFNRISFSGEWEEDVKVRGVIIYRNGVADKYEGQLLNDMLHGKGVMTFVSGSVY